MISFYAILFAVAFLLLFKMPSYIKNKKSVELKAMNRDSTMTLRGAAIIGIVLHHCSQYFDSLGILQMPVKQSG